MGLLRPRRAPTFPTREQFREFLLRDGPKAVITTGWPEGCRCPLARCAGDVTGLGVWVGRTYYSPIGNPEAMSHRLPAWAIGWLNWHDDRRRGREVTAGECVAILDAVR